MWITPQYLPLCQHLIPPSIRVNRFSIKRWSRALLNRNILNHCLVELSNTNLLSLNLIYKMEMSSVSLFAYLCLTLCKPMNCSTPGFPVHHQLPELRKLMSIESVMPSNHRILCHPLLLLPSIFSSIRVFFNESVLHIRRPKFWSFSFIISLCNEYSGLISFRIDWLDLLAVQGTLKSLLQHRSSKASFFSSQPSLWSNSHICPDYWKNHSFGYADLCWQSDVSAFEYAI